MSVVMQRKAMTQPRRGIRGGGWLSFADLDDVEDGEEEDPDDINKVPIETDVIEGSGPSWSVISREELTKETPQNEHYPDKDMRSVKAGHDKEAGTINSMLVEPEALMMEVVPLPCLN
jgi:hypothetical protein